jgi:hypothetical protein
MSKCDYCGKNIEEGRMLEKENRVFCDNLCRHSFEMNGNKPKEGAFPVQPESKSPGKNKNAIIGTIIGIIVAAVVSVWIQNGRSGLFSSKEPSMEVLNATANKINSSLPMMLDSDTELSTTVGLDGILQYHYRLVNYSIEQIDTGTLMPQLRQNIINSSCTIKDTRDLLKKGAMLEYIYHDKDRRVISSFSLNNNECTCNDL